MGTLRRLWKASIETSTAETVFIDTSAFVALRNRAEREHELARATLATLLSERALLFTSNYVFAETYTSLLVRLGGDEAIEWGRRFHAGRSIEVIQVEQPVEQEAWEILETHLDKRWSYVDDVVRADRARTAFGGVCLRPSLRPTRAARAACRLSAALARGRARLTSRPVRQKAPETYEEKLAQLQELREAAVHSAPEAGGEAARSRQVHG